MRSRGILAIAALAALWPGCLCVAQFPEALVNDDRGANDQIGSDRPGGDADALDGPRTEPRLHDLPRTEPRLHDLPRPDLPRSEGPKPDLAPARPDLKIVGSSTPTCNAGGAVCAANTDCTINAGGNCTGLVDCGSATICRVSCTGPGACSGGVNCNQAKQCFVTCDSGACNCPNQACVECGSAYCVVSCTKGSCLKETNCGGCGCKASCDGTSCGAPSYDKLLCNCVKQQGVCDCITFPCANP